MAYRSIFSGPQIDQMLSSLSQQTPGGVDLTAVNANIASNTAAIQANSTDIAANTASITSINTTVADHTAAIRTNAANVVTNSADIANHTAAIKTNTDNITANTANIATNTAIIANIKNGTSADAGTLNGNETFPLSKASGLLQTTLAKIATFVLTVFQGFTQSGTGAAARSIQDELRDRVSVKQFGAKGDGVTDDTVAIQAAIDYVVNSKRALNFPDGNYKITAPLLIGRDPNGAVTGLRFFGESRASTVITQATDNVPIFRVTGLYVHTLRFETMTVQYANMQTGNTGARVFDHVGPSDGSHYNWVWSDIGGANFYWWCYAPEDGVTWWGMTMRDLWLGDFAGGINMIARAAGEPNCKFDRFYISCQSAVETLFRHEAMSAQYDAIEVNSANQGISMLYDGSGGTHVIGHWAIEVGTYNQDGKVLFEIPNGVLLARYIYTNTLNIASGTAVYLVKTEGVSSFANIEFYTFNNADFISGSLVASLAIGPLPIRFKRVVLPFSSNVQLCDVVATGSADYTIVEDWNDLSAVSINGNANVTLQYDSPANQIFDTPLTAARVVTLPQGTPDASTVMFTGRRFRITKTNTSAYALTIKDFGGNTVATIASGSRGVVDLIWHRSGGANGFSWIVADQHTY